LGSQDYCERARIAAALFVGFDAQKRTACHAPVMRDKLALSVVFIFIWRMARIAAQNPRKCLAAPSAPQARMAVAPAGQAAPSHSWAKSG
jgi:hypothetical protein